MCMSCPKYLCLRGCATSSLLIFQFIFKALYSLWSVKNFCRLKGSFNYVSTSHSDCYLIIVDYSFKNNKKKVKILSRLIDWQKCVKCILRSCFKCKLKLTHFDNDPVSAIPWKYHSRLYIPWCNSNLLSMRPSWKMLCKQNAIEQGGFVPIFLLISILFCAR